MKLFQKISEKIGLTQTELKVNAFLVAVFLIGVTVKWLNWKKDDHVKNHFDYTSTDSIFYSTNKPNARILENKVFDYNLESSDFNKSNFNEKEKKHELAKKSVNLNNESLEQLIMLPGIGIKTAERILAYRKASSGFKKIDELLEVKGIGNSKFDKIKKYIFVR
jgi:competence protein ComEA